MPAYRKLFVYATLLAALALSAYGQSSDPSGGYGTVPHQTYLGEQENISVAHGNVSVQIPLLRLPGRDGHDFVVNVTLNSQTWWPSSYTDPLGHIYYFWVGNNQQGPIFPVLTYDMQVLPPDVNSRYYCRANYRVQMPDGRTVYFPDEATGCYDRISLQPVPSVDQTTASAAVPVGQGQPPAGSAPGSDLWFLFSDAGITYHITMGNGETLWFDTQGVLTRDVDSNGNTITYGNNGTITDTVGRTITNGGYKYTDANGNLQTITMSNSVVQIAPTFNMPPYPDPSPSTRSLLSSVVLANGDRYDFEYNNYGELTKVTYPSGGYTKYDYAQFSYAREITAKHVCRDYNTRANTPPGSCSIAEDTTTFAPVLYAYSPSIGGPYVNSSNTVVNAVGDKTVFAFEQTRGFETQRKIYSGTSTLLETVDSITGFFGPSQVKVTMEDGQVLMTQWDHTDPYTFVGYHSTNTTGYFTGNVTAKREYAYGTGAPGSLVRQTVTSWLRVNPVNGQDYTSTSIHILNRKASENVQDNGGTNIAQTQYEYDNYTTAMQASGATQHDSAFTTTYTTRGNVTAAKRWLNTTSSWLSATNTFDDAGNVLSTSDPGGHTTSFSYADNFTDGINHSAKAYVTQTTLPTTNGVSHIGRTQYYWNTGAAAASCGQNFPSATACTNTATLPQPDYASFTYERMGRPRIVTSGNGGQSSTCYSDDPDDSTCYSTNPQLRQTQKQTIVSGTDKVSVGLLDGVGNVIQTQLTSDPEGTDYVETTYDAAGRKKTVTNPHRSGSSSTDGTTTFYYDGLNRTTSVVNPDGTSTTITYLGNTVTVTDEAGKQRKTQTDALGRLIAVWEAPNVSGYNYETDYQYDLLNNLTCAMQKGTDTTQFTTCAAAPATWRPRSFTYDSLSRLLTANNPESGTVQYAYNSDSLLISKTDARGITINYNPTESPVDALHRMTKKTYSNGDTAVTYSYDNSGANNYGIGRRTGMTDGSGSSSWTYDAMGRAASETQTTSGVSKTISTSYNLDSSTSTVTYPTGSGSVLAYTYNAAGRVTLVQDTAHGVIYLQNTAYAPPGELNQAKYGSVKHTSIFNSRLQPCWTYATTGTLLPPSSLCTGSATPASLLDVKYDFGLGVNDNGTVLNRTNRLDSNRSVSYAYDALNRLASAATPNTDCTTLPTGITRNWGETITIDPWGNLSNRTVTKCAADPLSVVPLTNNRLSGFGYDASGDMTSNGGASYTYNAESQLKTAGGVTYTYDGDGNRVKKSSGTLYWGGGTLAESDLSGSLQREFIFAGGRRIARRDISNGSVHYYFTDHLGSTDIVTSASGVVQNDSDYYPYGGERVYTQTLTNQNYKFTGKERDTESGLDNFGARYDSSNLGRFMTPDWAARPTTVPYATFGDPQSLNLYGYVRNDPVSLADADGHYNDQSQQCDMRPCFGDIGDTHGGPGSLLDAFLASIARARAGIPLSADSPLDSNGYSYDGKTYETFGEAASAAQAQNQQAASTSDKRTDVMLSADSVPPKPSVNTGVQSEMDYKIVPQANTMQQLQDNVSKLRDDPTTQATYSKMEVKLWESQRGEKWQWQGSLTGKGHDVLNVFAQRADQRWYIDGKRVQMVIGKDSTGTLIKAWTVHVEIKPSGPEFSKVD